MAQAERRRKLGLPPEDNTKAQPSPQVVEEKKVNASSIYGFDV